VAVDVDGAPVLLDHLPGAGQADPLAREPADNIGRAVVALEDARQVGRRDPDATVADPDTRPGVPGLLLATDLHADFAALGAVLDGVAEQAAEHALEPDSVPRADQLRDSGMHLDGVPRARLLHLSPGAKSDRGDAKMLADVVRTDRYNHRPYAGSSDLVEAIKVLARAHQSLMRNGNPWKT
jgi:hypothetical protein